MRVLLIHNFYQQAGGEDAVFEQETSMLREHGVLVQALTFTNDAFTGTLLNKLDAATQTLHNPAVGPARSGSHRPVSA